ncbi:hypothetical protein Dsin_016546 [Dipteronia sinensis]|uniref:Transposase n=1 Tax=Dipteronia sinensis TaxID=43782 RepID=A0AAE0AEQ7_9ROSI|nr:hypothetical protein Dsin_016546 [Dipteronia sinensis]
MSRNTLKSEIFKLYNFERDKTKKLLESIESRVAITTDMWTSSTKMGYMVVTMHFIDKSWVLHSRIMRFIHVLSPHDAESLSDQLVKCLFDWNVDRKLSAIAVDNCSTNDSMIDKIKNKFSDKLLLGGKFFHMRCCAHILNLVVRDGLKVITDGIEKIRDSVCFWTASSKRIEAFEYAANQLKIKYAKKLVLDCPTRWNSTYFMLSVALIYKDVFVHAQQRDPHYKCLPEESDWQLATIMVEHLQPFYKLTEFFSGTKYPTANLVFPMICKMRETMNRWVSSPHIEIQTMARSMIAKFEKYWSDIPGVMAVAAVLDPRYKMLRVEFHFGRLYGFNADRQRDKVHGLLKELITEYESEALLIGVEQVEESSSFDYSIEVLGGDEEFELYKSQAVSSSNKSELERYLGEQVENNTPNFDILSWWKVNKGKYLILAKIAKDILANPVFTVASESAFSAGGRF